MRLADCFIRIILYVSYFLKTVEEKQSPYEKIKGDIHRLLSESEGCIKMNHIEQKDYDCARFAVCAWVDEAILNSSWSERDNWQREQLQRLYYQTTDAGKKFFENLNALGIHQKEVREVYYLCLAMGFKGQYCEEKDAYLLDQVKSSNLKVLLGSSVTVPSFERMTLFEEGYPPESSEHTPSKGGRRFSLVTALCLAGPVIFFWILSMIYSLILSGVGESFLGMVP